MLGTTVLIPTSLVPQMGGANVSNNGLDIIKAAIFKFNVAYFQKSNHMIELHFPIRQKNYVKNK